MEVATEPQEPRDGQQWRPTLIEYTLKTAPKKVIFGTLTGAVLGTSIGGGLSKFRHLPGHPIEHAYRTGKVSSLLAFSFFASREYAVRPLLTQLKFLPNPLESGFIPQDVMHPRTSDLLPTAISGFIAGAVISTTQLYFKPRVMAKIGMQSAIYASLIQLLWNQGDLWRIQLLSRDEQARELNTIIGGPDPEIVAKQIPMPNWKRDVNQPFEAPVRGTRETFSERSDRLFRDLWDSIQSGLKKISPLKSVDPEVYVRRLERRLEKIEVEKEEVRTELEMLLKIQSNQDGR